MCVCVRVCVCGWVCGVCAMCGVREQESVEHCVSPLFYRVECLFRSLKSLMQERG